MKKKIKGTFRENDLIGDYKNLPHYAIIGNPSDFYIFRQLNKKDFGQFSGWVKGQSSLWHKLKQINEKECAELCDLIFKQGNGPLGINSFKFEK
jgi:hypothetical protein